MGSGNSQRHHATDVCRVLFADVVMRIKANHFPGDLYRKRCGIKGLDLPDATFALKSCGPENFAANPIGTHRSDTRHHDTWFHPCCRTPALLLACAS